MAVESAMTTVEQPEKFSAALRFIEEVTSKCDEEQRRVLTEILSQNAETEYLKRHGLDGATDRETFKRKVPVVTYEDMRPDIQRIARGDFSPILCAQPISEFFLSSGTSGGENKLIPTTTDMDRVHLLHRLVMPVHNQYISGLDKGKSLNFMFTKPQTKTPGGLLASPILTSYYRSPAFTNRPFDPYHVCTSPDEAVLCLDVFQSMYTQMLCGLYDRLEVNRVSAVFPSALFRAIRFLTLHYRDLCHDISTGTLNPKITDQALATCMAKIMRADPELAEFIDRECREEKWEGIIKRIWPNTKCLMVIVTGAMAQSMPTLDYYSGGLPKVCTMYGSSECYFGFNLKPLSDPSEVSYTIFPNMGYFEFIPLDGQDHLTRDSMPHLVDLADVEVGKEYELVITTHQGLYRYQMGDILRVTGFYNSTPQFKFVRRKKELLMIESNKMDEVGLQKAVDNASVFLRPFDTSVVEYTSYADTKSFPGHYVIYWELLIKDPTNGPIPEVFDRCCLEMEESFNMIYRHCRAVDRSIGPLEIRVVKSGTFEELMDHALSKGATINQYKVPKCVTDTSAVELLDSRVVSTHFSPSTPQVTGSDHLRVLQ